MSDPVHSRKMKNREEWRVEGFTYDIIVKLKAGNPRNLPRANMTYMESGFLESFGHSYSAAVKLAHRVVVLSVSA